MGAEVSLIQDNILSDTYKRNGTVCIQKCGTKVVKCPVALVDVTIGRYSFIARCSIVDQDYINRPILLGHNLPEIDLVAETRPRTRSKGVDGGGLGGLKPPSFF